MRKNLKKNQTSDQNTTSILLQEQRSNLRFPSYDSTISSNERKKWLQFWMTRIKMMKNLKKKITHQVTQSSFMKSYKMRNNSSWSILKVFRSMPMRLNQQVKFKSSMMKKVWSWMMNRFHLKIQVLEFYKVTSILNELRLKALCELDLILDST